MLRHTAHGTRRPGGFAEGSSGKPECKDEVARFIDSPDRGSLVRGLTRHLSGSPCGYSCAPQRSLYFLSTICVFRMLATHAASTTYSRVDGVAEHGSGKNSDPIPGVNGQVATSTTDPLGFMHYGSARAMLLGA